MESLPAYFGGIFAILLLTSFVKILTTLNILRFGIGLHGAGFGVGILVLSLALSVVVMDAQVGSSAGVSSLFQAAPANPPETFRPFIERHTHQDMLERVSAMSSRLATGNKSGSNEAGKSSFSVVVAAFLLSEIKEAFQLGLLFIVPFIVVDLLVANALMALGVTQMPQALVGFPVKILLFFAVDGFALISDKLLGGYLS